jgi:hypothetical protein
MGIETAFLDAVLFRKLLKESVKKRSVSLLIANILNASIALALGLAWAFICQPLSPMLTVDIPRRFRALRTAGQAKLPL